MAVTALFVSALRSLNIFGDRLDNTIDVGRNAAGTILVNGGAVPVLGGTPTVANTSLIPIFGLGGDDRIVLDETNGALPATQIFAGAGEDLIVGGSAADLLFGQAGDDTLEGRGGTDLLFGGTGDDTLTGGDGDDQMFGEAGDDLLIWNPGDDSDLFEGGSGTDTALVNGGNGAEVFTLTANGARVRVDRVSPAPFTIDAGTTERVVINLNGGDDSFSATGNLAALVGLTVDGGAGNDSIGGSNGADLLLGGDGDDFVDGQQGDDVAFLGAGDDVFQWDPGDGSDVVEGQAGTDTLDFNGANIAENIDISANGGRARFFRDVASITMDLDDVETIRFDALGGADNIVVGDLSGTDVTRVELNLAAAAGGGDGQADAVAVNATAGVDIFGVSGSAGSGIQVFGLAAQTIITGTDGALDRLTLNGLGGADVIDASALDAGLVSLVINGGLGDDVMIGSAGGDFFNGGDGDDVAFMGAGDDFFVWNPGDDDDRLEGEAGFDTMLFNGANVSENIDISANGGRVLFFRDIANVTMDLNDMEAIDFNALGGADTVVVNDLSGTDMVRIRINLAGANGPDGQADTIILNATGADDVIQVSGDSNGITITGLAAAVEITGFDANDRLVINGLGGEDVIEASTLTAVLRLVADGGDGDDILVGSPGDDVLLGGAGDDVLIGGLGLNVLDGGSGNNVVI